MELWPNLLWNLLPLVLSGALQASQRAPPPSSVPLPIQTVVQCLKDALSPTDLSLGVQRVCFAALECFVKNREIFCPRGWRSLSFQWWMSNPLIKSSKRKLCPVTLPKICLTALRRRRRRRKEASVFPPYAPDAQWFICNFSPENFRAGLTVGDANAAIFDDSSSLRSSVGLSICTFSSWKAPQELFFFFFWLISSFGSQSNHGKLKKL